MSPGDLSLLSAWQSASLPPPGARGVFRFRTIAEAQRAREGQDDSGRLSTKGAR
jgi:hypothetical protein